MIRAFALAAMAGLLFFAAGQPTAKEKFTAATIKPFAPLPSGGYPLGVQGGPGSSNPSHITYTNHSLKSLLMIAYGVRDYQIACPDWMNANSARFVIEASIHPNATKEQVSQMLQNLLEDRFKIALHPETRDISLHELTVASSGSKLKPSIENPDAHPFITQSVNPKTGIHFVNGRSQTAAGLATFLSTPSFGPVVDRTGLTGKYDIRLEYSDIDLLTAIQDQLGLKLEPKKAPIEMLVVDHAEKTPAD